MKGSTFTFRGLHFQRGCRAHCRLQSAFRASHQSGPHRNAMGHRWQADMVRPQTGCAVGNCALYVRYSACHLASFDVLAARRIRRRTGDSVLLGYRHRRSHHHLEDGAAREIAMLKRLGLFEQVAFWVIGAGLPRNSLSHQGAAFLKWAIAASRGFTRSLRPPVRAKLPGFRCPEPWRPCC
jgi:hypothetical protein